MMGSTTLKKTGARLGGLGAAITLFGSLTMVAAGANPPPPQCEGPYNPANTCTAGTHTTGEYFGTALGCDKQGRHYVDNVSTETIDGPVGWYTWSCDKIDAGGDELWSLSLHGLALK